MSGVVQEEKALISAAPNIAWNSELRATVREELKRILTHPTFSTSHRSITLLGSVVKRVLDGGEVEIKERTLGVEVFGREANYDSNADPIVRRVANDVRKRLAQYYQEEPEGHIVKIHLLRGGYLPEFEFIPGAGQILPAAQSSPTESIPSEPPRLKRAPALLTKTYSSNRALVVVALALLIVAGLLLRNLNLFHSPINRIWKPLLVSKNAVIVCLPDDTKLHTGLPQGAQGIPRDLPPSTLFRDLGAGNSITSLLSRLNKQSEIRPSSALKYLDFQHGPVVLIGGMNNSWVPALLSNLRYSVQFNVATRDRWIQDAQSPTQRDWKIDGRFDPAPPPSDYAIITRVFNEETGQWILALSGLEGYATQAASELVTDPKFATKIPGRLRDSGNFQIVLRTSVLDEEPGPIQIEAFYSW